MRIGIISAMQDEIRLLRECIDVKETIHVGKRDYWLGTLHGHETVMVLSRIGKVAAASTVTALLERFGVNLVIFTGVAGAISPDLNIGDVVVGSSFIQHDMDASPLFPRWEVPLLGLSSIPSDPGLVKKIASAISGFLRNPQHLNAETQAEFRIHQPNVHVGLIASGDQFIDDLAEVDKLRRDHPGLLCVEMEGAAVAQVCHEYGVPFAVVRTISDKADHSAAVDFMRFSEKVAAPYSAGAVEWLLRDLTHAR